MIRSNTYSKLIQTSVYVLMVVFFIFTETLFNRINASVVSHKTAANVVVFTLDRGGMSLKICKENLVEVKYTLLDRWPSKSSLVINRGWKTIPEFTVEDKIDCVEISTKQLRVLVDKQTNAVRFTDLQGNVLLAEDGASGKSMVPATIAGINTYT